MLGKAKTTQEFKDELFDCYGPEYELIGDYVKIPRCTVLVTERGKCLFVV